jgi:periplasmic protein TonB
MAPLTKDSVEVAGPAASTPASQTATQSKTTSALRDDALSLEVAVKVHGSRVIDVARGIAPQTEPFEEQTVTMIVFPQGAVLRMSTSVNVTQMLVLTNLKTKQDSICRVLKVRPNANQGSYVEVEFTHRQPGYWGVQFPSEESVGSNAIAPPHENLASHTTAPVSAVPMTRPTTVTREVKPATVAPTATFAPPAKPESPFISIGSQEKVQEAASATAITKQLFPVEQRLESQTMASVAKNISVNDPLPAPPYTPLSVSMDDFRGDADSASAASVKTPTDEESASANLSASAEATANLSDATSDASQATAAEAFRARLLDSSFGSSAAKSSGASQNWMLIAACVAVLVAGLGAGIAYFRQHPANASARTAPVASSVSGATSPGTNSSDQLPAITPAGQPYMPGGSEANSPVRSNSDSAPSVAPPPSSTSVTKASVPSPNHSPAPAKQPAPGVTSDMMSTALTARPTTSSRGNEGQADQAPVLDAAAAAAGTSSLSGIAGPNAASLPLPTVQPEGPVKIGGNVKEPKLINSVAPVYPLTARSTGIQGDVVIDTTIDKSGNVVRMHVVSGPAMLRPPALESLRRWKYEPSKLDGEPVEVQMQVTIKFRL